MTVSKLTAADIAELNDLLVVNHDRGDFYLLLKELIDDKAFRGLRAEPGLAKDGERESNVAEYRNALQADASAPSSYEKRLLEAHT